MSRKWIATAVALVALSAAALATASIVGRSSTERPGYAQLSVDLGAPSAHARRATKGGGKKPKLLYLQSTTPITINPADASAGGVGPFVDVTLSGCSKVIDGGFIASRTDVFSQGTYVQSKGKYHVLFGLEGGAGADRTPYTVDTNLTCLKGTK